MTEAAPKRSAAHIGYFLKYRQIQNFFLLTLEFIMLLKIYSCVELKQVACKFKYFIRTLDRK